MRAAILVPLLVLAASSLAPAAPPARQAEGETVKEPRSKVLFPVALPPVGGPEGAEPHALAGVGLRTKTIFAVKVYAMGLYVDPVTAVPALARWRGRTAEELGKDDALFTELRSPTVGKSLRLVMRRDVDGDDMREAFEDALRPRVEHAGKTLSMPGGVEALRTFRSFFDVKELTRDQVLDFTWHPGDAAKGVAGRLATRVAGVEQPAIENEALGWALFDVYLGKKPIERKEKPKLVARLPGILAAGGR